MIIVLKNDTNEEDVDRVKQIVIEKGLSVNVVTGTEQTIVGVIGDTTKKIHV